MNIKRPLCVIAIAFAAAVYLFLYLFPYDYSQLCDDSFDGKSTSFTGYITGKESKTGYDGFSKVLILYLQAQDNPELKIKCELTDNYKEFNYVTGGSKEPGIGALVMVRGKYKVYPRATNPGEFDSRQYYAIQKIAYRIVDADIEAVGGESSFYKEALYELRCRLSTVVENSLNPEDAGIIKAMLLGDKSDMDEEIKDLYKRSGIIHIIAISGLHISIIGMGLFKLLRKLRTPIAVAAPLAVLFMWSYGVMSGMSTSAYRAVIMFILALTSQVIGRTYDTLSALALAGILLLIEQPLYLYHSGFLMSFGAVMAVGILLPCLTPISLKINNKILSGILCSISISLFTLPIYMNYYYTFPVYSVFLNVLVLPLMGVLMVLGILLLIIGSLFGSLGIIPGWPVHYVLELYKSLASFSTSLPGSTWYAGSASSFQVIVYLILLVIFIIVSGRCKALWDLWTDRRRTKGYREKVQRVERSLGAKSIEKMTLLMGLRYFIIITAVIIISYRTSPDLKITMLDVGQGDGIVVQTKTSTYLIDGGSTSKTKTGKYILTPFLSHEGIGEIDAVIITHEDEDHISGVIELLEGMSDGGIRIKNLVLPDAAAGSREDNYAALEILAEQNGVNVNYISRGMELYDENVYIKCFGPTAEMISAGANAHSTILFAQLGEFTALFTGDMEKEGESNLIHFLEENPIEGSGLTLLKVPHHGSKYTTSSELLSLLGPRISLISCGVKNSYGHPHAETLERLDAAGSEIFITTSSGAITVETDGKAMNIDEYVKD